MKHILHILSDGYNAVFALVVSSLMIIFGKHWIIFSVYLILNILDTLTCWLKDWELNTASCKNGIHIIVEKLGYWSMIIFAFLLSHECIEIGKLLNIDFGLATLLGWYVLASLTFSEARSICSNYTAAGFKVPGILSKSIDLMSSLINKNKKSDSNDDSKK